MPLSNRILTLEEANALLPKVNVCLTSIQNKRKHCDCEHDMLLMQELIREIDEQESQKKSPSAIDSGFQSLDQTVVDLEGEICSMREMGCLLRNLENGIVEFFGKHHGEKVFFSWKQGEPEIQFYRCFQDAPESRRPLN